MLRLRRAALLGVAAVTGASLWAPVRAEADETGSAGFSVLASDWTDEGSPRVLQDPSGFSEAAWLGAESFDAGRSVRIHWAARESNALRAYRVTATIGETGVTARWIVQRRSGASGGLFGYELRLPLVESSSSRIVATLEALGNGGQPLARLAAARTLDREPSRSLRRGPVVRFGALSSRLPATTSRVPSLSLSSAFVVRAWPEPTGFAPLLGATSPLEAAASVASRGPPA